MSKLRALAPILTLATLTACKDDVPVVPELDASDLSPVPGLIDAAQATGADAGARNCVFSSNEPPRDLACTGLYTDLVAKVVEPSALPFAPASALWSDGAEKQRWIELPDGGVIDNGEEDAWRFPVGTKTWKEFRQHGRRIETRFFHKVSPTKWLAATYVWSEDEKQALAASTNGVTLSLPGGATYQVPSTAQCEECHRGSRDQLLGFESVLLGLEGASGLTLRDLIAQGKLKDKTRPAAHSLPDDGTGASEPALRWLHVNCGVSCHNSNENAKAFPTGMSLRLEAATLTRPLREWKAVASTLERPAHTAAFAGQTRIIPGDPTQSLVVRLAGMRGMQQMPPLATRVVDEAGLALVRKWIEAMPRPDAGTMSPADAGLEPRDGGAMPVDDGSVPVADAAPPVLEDAAAPVELDAGVPDAGEPPVLTPVPIPEPIDAALPELDASIPPAV